ncbi:g7457 [Coccomyxa elongata]
MLDLPTVPASDIEPLNSLSSRSLPETISRDSFKSDHSGAKQHPNLTTKEIVREQNRKAAARFRQRQKDKLREYEKQIQELTAKLNAAEREKSTYELKCGEMEKVVREKMSSLTVQKPVESDDELAKREALAEALSKFCSVVRNRESPRCDEQELLTATGKLSMQHILPVYNECAQELARCLADGGETPGTEANQRIHEIISARRKLFHLMGWLDAQLFRRAAAMRYGGASDSAEPYTDPGKDHWRKVVAASCYTPEQKAGLLTAQNVLFARMHEILEAREAIMNTLQANFPCAETEHKNAPLYVQACKAADDLKANLEEEYVAVREFIVEFCRHMDFVQHAKMLVAGYPYTPDVLAITGIVREEAGAPQGSDIKKEVLLESLPEASPFRNLSSALA